MTLRFIRLWAFFLTVTMATTGCSETLNNYTEESEIGDLVGESVNIIEGTEYVPYIVLTNNYGGNTLLLRKNLLNKDMRMTNYYAKYEGSEIDSFLNGFFLNSIDENVRSIICDSDVEIVADDYYMNSVTIKVIQRKIFLLSYKELGISYNYHVGDEGEALIILRNSKSRIAAKTHEDPSSWWLRSVDTIYENCFYAVGANGEVGSTDASGMNGVRPAFCIPSDTPIIRSKDDGLEKFYVIDFSQS